MKYIKLTQNRKAIVDDKDYGFLNQWKWHYSSGYARRHKPRAISAAGYFYMHQVINHTPQGQDTDHINGNKLDNRKQNLRTVTRSENMLNTGKRTFSRFIPTSKFVGVRFISRLQKWQAKITVNYKPIHLGLFQSEKEAALAYKKYINDL